MKIYTKGGDKGETQLFGCDLNQRVGKGDYRIEVLGNLDELNAHLAALAWDRDEVKDAQNIIFHIGTFGASNISKKELESFTAQLEYEIDYMTDSLPPLKNFILPGGHDNSIKAHLARAVCRRTERSMCLAPELFQKSEIQYINRLSDYLFTLAREYNQLEDTPDVIWEDIYERKED